MLAKYCISIAVASFLLSFGMQNSAAGLDNQSILSSGLESIDTNSRISKQSHVIALNGTYYWSPQRDCKIFMPGILTGDSTEEELTSVSATTRTAYTIIYRDFPIASRIPIPQVRQVLQSAMRETVALTGKVIKTTNLVIDGHPGLELLMEHSDGSLGQYRAFVVNQRLYFMGAMTRDELTTESVNFFDSFRVYPERIRYSSFGVY